MTGLRAAVLAAAVWVLAIAGCAGDGGTTDLVRLDGVPIEVSVADTSAEHLRGLQGADPLDDGEGMLFVWDEAAVRTFAMKDVSFPIDVIFFDESLRVSAVEPLDPGDEERVTSPGPSPYVLETPQGWAERAGIAIGAQLQIEE
jgi:hypothetical protein